MASAAPAHQFATSRSSRMSTALSGPARMVLGLVLIFTAAFVAVIMMKIAQEWQIAKRDAEAEQARTAIFLSERAGARLARVYGAVSGAAGGVATDWDEDGGADIYGHLVALTARKDVLDAALLSDDGRVRGATDAAAGALLASALSSRDDRLVWTAAGPDGRQDLYVAAELELTGRTRLLVARLDAAALTPGLTGPADVALVAGDAVITAVAEGATREGLMRGGRADAAFDISPQALADLQSGDRAAVRATDTPEMVIAAAPLGRTGMQIMVAGEKPVDVAGWRRTLIFYVLLLVAPLLVAIGLCAVLLMQMDSIRQARQALSDSERRFRLAIEGARCGVWDWDVANDTVFVTESLARMMGRRESATITGAEFLSLVRQEDQEKLKIAIRGAPGSGEVDVEFGVQGLPVSLHARGKPWTGSDGQLSGRIVGVAIDVTQQKGAQARVTAAESRLRAALESMSESFVLWDARERLVLTNRKFRDFFHLDEKLVKPGAAYEMLEIAAQGAILAAHDSAESEATELELADGRWVHISERRTADGGKVSIGTDITAMKRQESQLIERDKAQRQTLSDLRKAHERLADLAKKYEKEKIRAEEANRSKSEFLANMSHELRTPLNAINGFSEIMIEQMFGPLGDPRYQEYVGDILSSGQHLLELINDILDMSKIEAGKLKLSTETVFPDEIAEQCVRLMRGKAKDSELDLSLDNGDVPEIIADPRAIKQVLLNLISNAIKFTPERGAVTVRARSVDGPDMRGVRFEVIDTGIGIAAEDLPRLGRPFEQIESQHSKTHQGSGLGLALSKSLVAMHGGTFLMESEPGRGTTVSFTLPLVAVVEPENEEEAVEPSSPKLRSASSPPASAAPAAPSVPAAGAGAVFSHPEVSGANDSDFDDDETSDAPAPPLNVDDDPFLIQLDFDDAEDVDESEPTPA